MKNLQINTSPIGAQEYNLGEKVGEDIYIYGEGIPISKINIYCQKVGLGGLYPVTLSGDTVAPSSLEDLKDFTLDTIKLPSSETFPSSTDYDVDFILTKGDHILYWDGEPVIRFSFNPLYKYQIISNNILSSLDGIYVFRWYSPIGSPGYYYRVSPYNPPFQVEYYSSTLVITFMIR